MATTWRQTAVRADQLPEIDPSKLRELASWYRELAERTGNATIWEARLLTAKDLNTEADRIERVLGNRIDLSEANCQLGGGIPMSLTIVSPHAGRARGGDIVVTAEQGRTPTTADQLEDREFVVDKITAGSSSAVSLEAVAR
jgi:hypothetical protein